MKLKGPTPILILFLLAIYINKSVAQDVWEPAGISGGRVSTIVKVTNNVFVAGFIGGGLYRSIDGGQYWHSISRTINNLGVFDLKVNSVGDIYAGAVRSIYKSTDQGLSWNKVHNSFPPNGYAEDIVFDASDNIYVAQNYGGVYKSTDGGNSWAQINSGLPSSKYIDKVGFTSNNILLASDLYRGVYKSTDYGVSWVKSNMGLDSTYFVTSFTSNSAGVIFVSTFGDGPYKSTDNGNSWVSIKGDLTLNYCDDFDVNSGGDLFLTTTQQLYKSTNGGINWTNMTTMFNGFAFNSAYIENNNIWATTLNSGVIKSIDGGINWSNYTNGLTSTLIHSLVADASGNLFASIPGKGLYSSTDNGQTWNKITIVNETEDTFIRTVEIIPSGGLIVFNVYNGIYVTNDLISWVPFNTGLTSQSIFWLAVSSNYYFSATSDGKVFRSPRTSPNWIDITNPSASGYSYDLFVSSAGDLYYLFDEEIFKSTNSGDDWIDIGNGVTGYSFSIAQNSFGDIFVGTDQGVFRSTNAGADWTKDLSGLTDGALSLAIFGGTTVFAGGYSSVSRSNDFGQTWTPFTSGIENCQITDLVFGYSDVLFAAAENMGAYRTFSPVSSMDETEPVSLTNFELYQNYPNPFNPTTKIRYQIPVESNVTLKIYDILGKEVAELVNEFKTAGFYSIDFNASKLFSGVYFYKIEAGGFVQTKKMILIK
jgi:photosystem II stability/assembly factor-like uncharacterized protein